MFPDFDETQVVEETTQPEVESQPRETQDEPMMEDRDVDRQATEQRAEGPSDELSVLGLSDLADKQIRVKVLGQEKVISGEELVKRLQLGDAAEIKFQQAAEMRKQLEEERKQLEAAKKAVQQPASPKISDENQYLADALDPMFKAYESRIAQLEQRLEKQNKDLDTISEQTRPSRYQAALSQLDDRLKAQDEVFSDFRDYVPKIENHLRRLELEDPLRFGELNTMAGYEVIYKDFKIKDMAQGKTKQQTTSRPKPKLAKVEGGEATPTQTDDETASYTKLFNEAVKTGNWTKVLEAKYGNKLYER